MFEVSLPPLGQVSPGLLDPRDPDPARLAELRCWLRIQERHALAPQRAVGALREGRRPAELAAGRLGSDRDLEATRHALVTCGACVLPWASPAYPDALQRLSDAPPVLLLQGDAAALCSRTVGIVGARAASSYGRRVARRFGEVLGAAGVVVVSGLAAGVDGCAHDGALAAGGRTVAVQARGPEQVYPAQHRSLARRICEQGAIVTELPPGTPPRAPYFPLRNRLIAALSEIVLVIEARERSGSLVTARHALDQGLDVMAVPGPIDAPTSAGTNRLLRDGASPALEPEDVLAALGLDSPEAAADPIATAGSCEVLSDAARRLHAALRDAPADRDELTRVLGQPPHELALAVSELELAGAVEVDHDGRLRAVGGLGRGGLRGAG